MLDNILNNPKELTPSMVKYKDIFYRKSKTNVKNRLEKDIDKYNVLEWDDGWVQFKPIKDSLYIRTMYCKSDGEFKFEFLYELAKSLSKKEIVFDTERNPEAWIKLLESRNYKSKIKCYTISVAIGE